MSVSTKKQLVLGIPLYVIVVLLIGFNLRPIMASVGPLLKLIQADTGISYQVGGLLTTLPVMLMGLLSLFANGIYRVGIRRGVSFGLVLVVVACALRFFNLNGQGLLFSAALAGVGIGFLQTLMPGYVKGLSIPNGERLMGLYVTTIMGGAALTFLVSPQLIRFMGWREALGIWVLPALLALPLWLALTKNDVPMSPLPRHSGSVKASNISFWFDSRAWLLASIFIISSAAFTLLLAWFAPFYISLGWSAQGAGAMMASLMTVEVILGTLISHYVPKVQDKRIPFLICLSLAIVGYLIMLIAPKEWYLLVILFLGIGVGSIFPLSIMITMLHAHDAQTAGKLTAFVQGVGYLVAGVIPWIAGILRDLLGSFDYAWLFVLILMLIAVPLAWRLNPQSIRVYAQRN